MEKNTDFLNLNLQKSNTYSMVTIPKAVRQNVHALLYTEDYIITRRGKKSYGPLFQ